MKDTDKKDRKLIIIILWVIGGLAFFNLFGMIAATWLLMGTVLSIILFLYENFSKRRELKYVFLILGVILFIGGFLHIHTPLDAALKGEDPSNCKDYQPLGFFTGGCNSKPSFNQIGTHINDSLALLALAGTIGINLRKKRE